MRGPPRPSKNPMLLLGAGVLSFVWDIAPSENLIQAPDPSPKGTDKCHAHFQGVVGPMEPWDAVCTAVSVPLKCPSLGSLATHIQSLGTGTRSLFWGSRARQEPAWGHMALSPGPSSLLQPGQG